MSFESFELTKKGERKREREREKGRKRGFKEEKGISVSQTTRMTQCNYMRRVSRPGFKRWLRELYSNLSQEKHFQTRPETSSLNCSFSTRLRWPQRPENFPLFSVQLDFGWPRIMSLMMDLSMTTEIIGTIKPAPDKNPDLLLFVYKAFPKLKIDVIFYIMHEINTVVMSHKMNLIWRK